MSFYGYKYRFHLYAAHSNISGDNENTHYHNFTITLYIKITNKKPDINYEVERIVKEWFEPFQGMKLTQTEMFRGKETTIEEMGNVFYHSLFDLIQNLGYELIKLEIYENPTRVYAVSSKRIDSIVNEISDIPLECLPVMEFEEQITEPEKNDEPEHAIDESEEEVASADEIIVTSDLEKVEIQNEHETNKAVKWFKIMFGFCGLFLLAAVTMYIVKSSGKYPQGSDTYCHLYRADLILDNLKAGNWFPLYDKSWYNGVEIMRYWGPLPLYIIAGLEWITQGSVLDAYIAFLGFLIVFGGAGWLLWGYKYHRIGLSIVIGLVWFYLPENMRVVISSGNLPTAMICALLPYFFYFYIRLMERKKTAFFPLVLVTVFITLCHLGITIMLLVSVIIITIFYSKMNHCIKWPLCSLEASFSGVMLAGLWAVPALIGGSAGGSSTNQVMKTFFEDAFISLNPLTRFSQQTLASFYFGISVLILCLIGIFFGSSKVRPGFLTAVILYLCTTKSVYVFFEKLPFSKFLWMIRFVPIGLAAAMFSFFMWKQLKKQIVLLFCVLLILDSATSFSFIYFPKEERVADAQQALDERADTLLISQAKSITNQRMAIMELSKYGSFAPYYVSGVGKKVDYTFGAGWEGAGIASNIVSLNAATENGWYVYLFDRALELGDDTILIPIENLKEKENDVNDVIEASKISGYQLVTNNGFTLLFHKNTYEHFGVITDYKNIAIGNASSGIAMIFPSFEEGSKININDYTYQELSKYQIIYLSGFTYDDKEKAEDLILKLSENGIKIFIDMNKIPEDKSKKQKELFGVSTQSIKFTETFPEFEYNNVSYKSLDFSPETNEWNSIYLDGLESIEGYCDMTNRKLPYIGTAKNQNIHLIGLNIIYYLQMTRDSDVNKMVNKIFGLDQNEVSERKIVPIQVQTEKNKIFIKSDYDNVNSTLTNIDILSSEKNYLVKNHLIEVNSGTTVININYPHIQMGSMVTCLGLILAILIYIKLYKMEGNDYEKA